MRLCIKAMQFGWQSHVFFRLFVAAALQTMKNKTHLAHFFIQSIVFFSLIVSLQIRRFCVENFHETTKLPVILVLIECASTCVPTRVYILTLMYTIIRNRKFICANNMCHDHD